MVYVETEAYKKMNMEIEPMNISELKLDHNDIPIKPNLGNAIVHKVVNKQPPKRR